MILLEPSIGSRRRVWNSSASESRSREEGGTGLAPLWDVSDYRPIVRLWNFDCCWQKVALPSGLRANPDLSHLRLDRSSIAADNFVGTMAT